jgi:flavin-dependent dehydrogenase
MRYDVVIIGGSLSGSAAAILLRRACPGLRILVVERAARFGRRVGEATVEVSGFFLGRALGLANFLNETQLLKQGMRFWFANEETATLDAASEIGPRYHVRLPAWQLDRSVVDEELLRRAAAYGIEVRRPAQATDVQLREGGEQIVTVRDETGATDVRCRWVIDASGVAAVLARKQGWLRSNTEHPTASAWARWRRVKDWDGSELAEKFPQWAAVCYGSRNTATNHVVGDGWWSWWIPLKGGDVSVGVVFDQRLVTFPNHEGKIGDRLKQFLSQHPVAAEMLEEAEWIDGDTHWRKNLAYVSSTFAGDGFALVGDAAAFLDPLYSPGMDWISFTVTSTVELIAAQTRGEPMAPRIETHNATFARSYARWFEAVYKDKYEYLGEFDLMQLAFRMDLGLYYLGIVSQPFKFGAQSLESPPFARPVSVPIFRFMRCYNRRFAAIARDRRRRLVSGRANGGRRYLFQSFGIGARDLPRIMVAAVQWMILEITEGWRTWFVTRNVEEPPRRVEPAREELAGVGEPP